MTTEKQVMANRKNAERSTGPKSPEGKARVCGNATKHGSFCNQLTLPGESPEQAHELVTMAEEQFGATGPLAQRFAEGVALSIRQEERLTKYEEDLIDHQVAAAEDESDFVETLEIESFQKDFLLIRVIGSIMAAGEAERVQLVLEAVQSMLQGVTVAVKRHPTLGSAINPAIAMLQHPVLVKAETNRLEPLYFDTAMMHMKNIILTHKAFMQGHVNSLKAQRQKKIDRAKAEAQILSEKALRQIDKYRTMQEKSVLRRLEIIKEIKLLSQPVKAEI